MTLSHYAKGAFILIGLYVFISMLSIAQGILLPLIYATMLAISLNPVVNFFEKRKMSRAPAISVVLTLVVLLSVGLIMMISSQARLLNEAYPTLVIKFQTFFNDSVNWSAGYFHVGPNKIHEWIAKGKEDAMNNSGSAIGTTLITLGGFLSVVFLTPVYIFMILFYKTHLIEFIHRVCGGNNNSKVSDILNKTKTIVQGYLVGLFIEFAIIASLNSVCLMILGIKYAILFGILGALLNVIPYIGGIIAVGMFMVIAFVTKSPIYALYVLMLYTLIQFTDNHYIVPKIIGSKVKLNALICLIAVIAGGALWGVPGMFLSIPLTAIIKLIFDHIESLSSWGFLLGDTTPPFRRLNVNFKDFKEKFPRIMPPFKKE